MARPTWATRTASAVATRVPRVSKGVVTARRGVGAVARLLIEPPGTAQPSDDRAAPRIPAVMSFRGDNYRAGGRPTPPGRSVTPRGRSFAAASRRSGEGLRHVQPPVG